MSWAPAPRMTPSGCGISPLPAFQTARRSHADRRSQADRSASRGWAPVSRRLGRQGLIGRDHGAGWSWLVTYWLSGSSRVGGSAGKEAGRPGGTFSVWVRSPHVWRRQALIFGSATPNTSSMNRSTEVWSKSSLDTQPPALTARPRSSAPGSPARSGCPPTNSSAVPGRRHRRRHVVEQPVVLVVVEEEDGIRPHLGVGGQGLADLADERRARGRRSGVLAGRRRAR